MPEVTPWSLVLWWVRKMTLFKSIMWPFQQVLYVLQNMKFLIFVLSLFLYYFAFYEAKFNLVPTESKSQLTLDWQQNGSCMSRYSVIAYWVTIFPDFIHRYIQISQWWTDMANGHTKITRSFNFECFARHRFCISAF